jgi:hypothetical protein
MCIIESRDNNQNGKEQKQLHTKMKKIILQLSIEFLTRKHAQQQPPKGKAHHVSCIEKSHY